MTRAFLSLGSNLGDRERFLHDAVTALGDEVVQVSPIYETEPVGGPEQGAYLNQIVELDTEHSPRTLLALCQVLEAAADRVRTVRWGPRTLDVDIVWLDGITVDDPDLKIPHERWRERRFVLAPLADIAPELVDPKDLENAVGEVTKLS